MKKRVKLARGHEWAAGRITGRGVNKPCGQSISCPCTHISYDHWGKKTHKCQRPQL